MQITNTVDAYANLPTCTICAVLLAVRLAASCVILRHIAAKRRNVLGTASGVNEALFVYVVLATLFILVCQLVVLITTSAVRATGFKHRLEQIYSRPSAVYCVHVSLMMFRQYSLHSTMRQIGLVQQDILSRL